jgi:hypothetical protein
MVNPNDISVLREARSIIHELGETLVVLYLLAKLVVRSIYAYDQVAITRPATVAVSHGRRKVSR